MTNDTIIKILAVGLLLNAIGLGVVNYRVSATQSVITETIQMLTRVVNIVGELASEDAK